MLKIDYSINKHCPERMREETKTKVLQNRKIRSEIKSLLNKEKDE